ncbi:Complement C1q tumor necrosis factor-related protein 9 [Cricetulus griseus]|uniref:Complement C1q tumor necrosis factor-related protein 9 n=1 Tax=Cricetulus griseus TaxID=10029 RepID=G3H8R3_CRIGR|nr:Complement C1q tumor necrosis factor-related protein 9 [Cricetulus griseus]
MGLLTRWPCEFATDGHTPAAVPDSTKSLSVPREQSLRMASVFDLEELVDGVRNVQVSLVKNGVKVLHTKDGYMSSEDQASGGIVLELKLGDEVWMQVTGGERFNGLFADEDDDTTFTGFLLFSSL